MLTVFIALVALGLDTYFVATAKFQQSSTAESIALGTLKSLKEPAVGAEYHGSPNNEASLYNFAIDHGALAGASTLIGTEAGQISSSELQVRYASPNGNGHGACTSAISPGHGNGKRNGNGNHTSSWCGFEASSDQGSVIFGYVDPLTFGTSAITFSPVSPGSSADVNAVKVRLQLKDPNISPMVLPFKKLLLGERAIMFESSAIAYYAGPGKYHLVPPTIPPGSV